MLKVKYRRVNGIIDNVVLSGHAQYDIKGKDIVCASASSIYITTINAILRFDKHAISYKNESVSEIQNIKKDDVTNKLLDNMLNMLMELEENYKKNIKIMEE